LRANFPKSEVLACSARYGTGLEAWFDRVTGSELRGGEAMELDYETYAEGEACLGWLNCTVAVSAMEPIEGEILLEHLAAIIQHRLNSNDREIAHLKITLSPNDDSGEVAVINVVRNDHVPELSQRLSDPLQSGQLVLNLRAEAPPEELHRAVTEALERYSTEGVVLTMDHLEHFRPAKPVPTHRMARLEVGS